MRVVVLSDIHYACEAERARHGWESRVIASPALRWVVSCYRRFLWLADPTAHNHQLEAFIGAAGQPDWVIANGDYSCDSAFVGVSDDASLTSARQCLERLRRAFGDRLRITMGDHELGKMSLIGGVGGPRLASWHRATVDLGIPPIWTADIGEYRLVGITSSLVALPAFAPELLDEEREKWQSLREAYLAELRETFGRIPPGLRILLFCHDPTALPFLAREAEIAAQLPRVARTVVGHLHSEAILKASCGLRGMPEVRCLGNTVRRLSGALRKARAWTPFRVVLCPSLAGIQALKDGGFLELELKADQTEGVRVTRHRLPWRIPRA
jgi:hypothetical protein